MHVLRKRPLRIIACPASSDSSLFAGSRAISSWTKSKCQRGAFLVKCELLIMNDQYQVIWQGGVVCITQRGSMVYVLGVEWNGGPVHIACPGVKLNEIQPSSSPRWSKRNILNSNRSSRNYPSMIQFVITGVIGF